MIDRNSQTWAAVKKTCEEGIAHAGTVLETHGTSVEVTEYQRGYIAALRAVLALSAPPLDIEVGGVEPY